MIHLLPVSEIFIMLYHIMPDPQIVLQRIMYSGAEIFVEEAKLEKQVDIF